MAVEPRSPRSTARGALSLGAAASGAANLRQSTRPELAPRGLRNQTFVAIVTPFFFLPSVPFHFRGCSGFAGSVTTSRWLTSGGGTCVAAASQERPPARVRALPDPGHHGHQPAAAAATSGAAASSSAATATTAAARPGIWSRRGRGGRRGDRRWGPAARGHDREPPQEPGALRPVPQGLPSRRGHQGSGRAGLGVGDREDPEGHLLGRRVPHPSVGQRRVPAPKLS
jgi:hypothetical protein